ncbi:SDR family NAD(P)-dependent oxidoreductase [candidate division KSB1 bacterium]|nr:SDR family NAD(P)-dependent oxidoreductase [candidate division KSB1 bacterium]
MIESLEGKEILITGGLGFIGSNLAHRLVHEKAQVTIFDAMLDPYGWNRANVKGVEDRINIIKGDVRDRTALKKAMENKDVVYHLAAQVGREISMENPYLDTEINCTGTLNLVQICAEMQCPPRVVYAGSRGQIGEPVYLPVDEDHPTLPTDVYGINKLAAEKYILLYGHVYGFPAVSLRLNNAYGPRCQMQHGFYGILNWFIKNAMQEKPITVYGDGLQTRDYVYIDDIVQAFYLAGIDRRTDQHVYFIGSGTETKFLDMVKQVIKSVGKGEIVHVPFPPQRESIDIRKFVVTIEKFHQHTGWLPRVDLESGIEKTVEFYRQFYPDYIRD